MMQRTLAMLTVVAIASLMLVPTAGASPVEKDGKTAQVGTISWVEEVVDCTVIDGEDFCTDLGFVPVEFGSREWDRWVRTLLAADVGSGGDMSTSDLVAMLHRLSVSELTARQATQIAEAGSAVGRVKLVAAIANNEVIPDGFFDKYPDLGVAEGSPDAVGLRAAARDASHRPILEHLAASGAVVTDLGALDPNGEEFGVGSADPMTVGVLGAPIEGPWYRYIISSYYTKQETDCYCGPATMQAIDWADDGGIDSQATWASLLGTHSGGGCATALSNIVSRINSNTNWDSAAHGGAYSIISLDGKSQTFYMFQHEWRIGVKGAPVVEHVYLSTSHFPYLIKHTWSSGHFQTGRGYSYNSDTISIFEPYNEADWLSGGAASGKIQYVSLLNMYNASQAHPHKNMGA